MTFNFSDSITRIALVSDIHAYTDPKNSHDSSVNLSDRSSVQPNPLIDLISFVRSEKLQAESLFCAGDICNKADYPALSAAWEQLHELTAALNATNLIATCGNHDLDSRYSTGPDPDPRIGLQALIPNFPLPQIAQCNKFWAQHYAICELDGEITIVVLNTSTYHGSRPGENEHGRVSVKTIKAIAAELSNHRKSKAHILLCHHHPLVLSGFPEGTPDTQALTNGQDLLDALSEATRTSWLVIHGHRHFPLLLHGASKRTTTPFILGASSLGACVTSVSNQFHILNIYKPKENYHASIAGTIETWSWTYSGRWGRTPTGSGFPPECGFGYKGNIESLADDASRLIPTGYMSWNSFKAAIPSVAFLMPPDIEALEEAMDMRGLQTHRRGSIIEQVGRR